MTLAQLAMYSEATAQYNKQQMVNSINNLRIGFHADTEEYQNIMRDLTRNG